MVAVAIVLALFAMLLGLVLLSGAAWLRAEDALRSLRALSRRLGEVEKRVGVARPGAEPAGSAEAQPGPALETSLEERIALAWFARIGAGILLVGAGVFFLQGTAGGISRAGRVLAGGLFGLAALAFAEAIRSRARPLYVHAVLGIGVAVLLSSAFASHGLYGIASPGAAFAAVLAVAALAAALSVRHRAGIALSLAVVGGLLAPELLWRDAPAAGLLLYVLVLSGAAFWVALRAGFGIAPWLALVGSFALLAAWRVRVVDSGPSGPHRALADRLVPLGFAAAFTVEWLLVHARARRPGGERLRPLAFLVAALVLAHALFAALLFDRPALLGLAFAVLAILGVRLLGREQRPVLLLVPLLVASLALAGAVHPGAPPAATLAALAAWGAVYAAGFLRPGAAPLALSGVAGASFLVLAGELLAPHRPRAFGLVAVAWALAYAWLAMARRSPVLLASTAAVSFLGLAGAAAPIGAAGDPVLVAIGGAWALVYLGGLAWRNLAGGRGPGVDAPRDGGRRLGGPRPPRARAHPAVQRLGEGGARGRRRCGPRRARRTDAGAGALARCRLRGPLGGLPRHRGGVAPPRGRLDARLGGARDGARRRRLRAPKQARPLPRPRPLRRDGGEAGALGRVDAPARLAGRRPPRRRRSPPRRVLPVRPARRAARRALARGAQVGRTAAGDEPPPYLPPTRRARVFGSPCALRLFIRKATSVFWRLDALRVDLREGRAPFATSSRT